MPLRPELQRQSHQKGEKKTSQEFGVQLDNIISRNQARLEFSPNNQETSRAELEEMMPDDLKNGFINTLVLSRGSLSLSVDHHNTSLIYFFLPTIVNRVIL